MYDLAPDTQPRPGAILTPDDPINTGLVEWWPMWEGAGGVAHGLRGVADGVLTSMDPATDWVTGRDGYVISDSAADAYVATGLRTWGFSVPFAVAIWFKTSLTGYQAPFVLGRAMIADEILCYTNPWGAGGEAQFGLFNTSGSGIYWGRYGSRNVADGQWHLCGGQMDAPGGGTANLHIWVDGQRDDFGTTSAGAVSNVSDATPRRVQIGSRSLMGGVERFVGEFGNARVWRRSLTDDDWAELYAQPWSGLWVPSGRTYFGYGNYFVQSITGAIG